MSSVGCEDSRLCYGKPQFLTPTRFVLFTLSCFRLPDKHFQGIRFHGLTIPDCQKVLPSAPGGKEMTAESMLWLLMTGKVPTEAESRELSRQLAEQGELPPLIEKLVDPFFVSLNAHHTIFSE